MNISEIICCKILPECLEKKLEFGWSFIENRVCSVFPNQQQVNNL